MTAMRNVAAIFDKEWHHYFGSPIGYVAFFVWTLLFGIFYYFAFTFFLQQSQAGSGMGGPQALSMNEYLIQPILQNMAVVALLLTPMLTMRAFAEEKRTGTIELLATSPLTDAQIVWGKFLAALALYGLMILVAMINVATLWHYSQTPPEWKPVLTGMLSLFLLGGCFLSLGLFVSSLTKNQIVAGVLSFGLFLGIWTMGWAEDPSGGPVLKVIAYMGVTTHMEELMRGVLDLKDLVFYTTFIAFGLFLTQQSLESQRWRA